ncbi:MAG: efflux RND transporter periplasmic adaptor subunit [Desulfatirhabdiaceae bacterium]
MKKRLKFIIPFILILVVATIVVLKIRTRLPEDIIQLSGTIEATTVQAAFRIPGRLIERLVDEGQPVKAGQIVARLENTDQKLQVSQAQANVQYAQSVVSELEAGSRPEEIERARFHMEQAQYSLNELISGSRKQEIGDSQSELVRAVAASESAGIQLAQATADFDRYQMLYDEGGVSLREFEIWRTRYKTAQSALDEANARIQSARERLSLRQEGPRAEQIQRARAMLSQGKAEYELVKAGPRTETIIQAKARLSAAQESLKQAGQQLSYTELISPLTGTILSKSAEPGEYLNPGATVVVIGDLENPWLRGYVRETNLGKIHLGQDATVTTDSYPGKIYSGKIAYISDEAEFTPKTVQTFEERVKLMIRLKIELKNPSGELKPGMPADARIQVNQ